MSNDNKSIHESDFELICAYYSSIDRQGPGSQEVTIQALNFIENLGEQSQIVDIGCGTGGQTMVLAQNTNAQITGLDLFPVFIDLLEKRAKALNLESRVKGIVASMDQLPFEKEQWDVIWSEGAIYNVGFEKGLNEWKQYLKKGGYIALTEVSWFTDERPDEINQFWMDAYPEIDTIPNKLEIMQKAGYQIIASFILPEYCWTDQFYTPQIEAQRIFLEKYRDNQVANELVDNQRHEATLYSKYKAYYGYVFYIGKKI